jgi:hypothetical protein
LYLILFLINAIKYKREISSLASSNASLLHLLSCPILTPTCPLSRNTPHFGLCTGSVCPASLLSHMDGSLIPFRKKPKS